MATFPRVYRVLSLFYLTLLVLSLLLDTAATFYSDGPFVSTPWLLGIVTVLVALLLYLRVFSRRSRTGPQPGHTVIQKILFSIGKGLIMLSGLVITGFILIAVVGSLIGDGNGMLIGTGFGFGLLLYFPGVILVNIGSLSSSKPVVEDVA